MNVSDLDNNSSALRHSVDPDDVFVEITRKCNGKEKLDYGYNVFYNDEYKIVEATADDLRLLIAALQHALRLSGKDTSTEASGQ